MERTRAVAMLGVLGILGSACGGEEGAPEGEPVVVEEPAAEPATATGDPSAGTALTVDSLPGAGAYLADGSGRSLYLLEGEPQGQSTCYDACAEEWPPFLAPQGTPEAQAPAVQAGLIGTLQRRDGATQVTYGGHALYYYHEDQGPGQTNGQDLTDQWGEWYLVRPSGEPLEGEGGGQGGS